MERRRIHVAVGVIHGADGKILVAQRAAQQHLGGLWEFPGGKVEDGESVTEALARELHEELGIHALEQSRLCKISHDYDDKSVLLDVWNVHSFSGQAHGREGQPLRWLTPQQLHYEDFPQANKAIIRALRLADFFAVLDTNIAAGTLQTRLAHLPERSLVRLRETAWPAHTDIDAGVLQALKTHQHGIIVDLTTPTDERWQTVSGLPDAQQACQVPIYGVHANRHVAAQLTQRPVPEHLLFGVSCHNTEELAHAAACGADYVLLSPVLSSQSHPRQGGMGWEQFTQLAREIDVAVYAMGGLQKSDLLKAKACGARGIAGIGLFAA